MSDEYLAQLKALERRLSHLERLEEQGMSRGWIGSAWQKAPLTLGYSAKIDEQVADTSAAAGSNTLSGTAVPSGEVWVIQAACASDLNNDPTIIQIRALTTTS